LKEHLSKRRHLIEMLSSNGKTIMVNEGFEKGLERLHEHMDKEELDAFSELKDTTKDMFTYNSLIFQLLKDNPTFFARIGYHEKII